MSKRVAVIGSREFDDLDQVDEFIDSLPPGTVVVSGAARGVDSRAAARARARGLEVDEFPVTDEEWREIGRSAGMRRNERMLRTVQRVAAFWDGESPGTRGAIEFAETVLKIHVERHKPRLPVLTLREVAAIVPELRRMYVLAVDAGFKPSPLFKRFGRWVAGGKLELREPPETGSLTP